MPAYGPEIFDELLKRIHEGQSEVSGDDLGPFQSLLTLGFVEFNGEGGPDHYTGVLPTVTGTRRVLDPTGKL